MPKFIDALEKRVEEVNDALDETLRKTTDSVKGRVDRMRARVDHYLDLEERRHGERRRDSYKDLIAVKG